MANRSAQDNGFDQTELSEMLKAIPASKLSYNEWLNVGMALHYEGLPCSVWDDWSASDPDRYYVGECAKRWETFGKSSGDPITGATICRMALDNGWKSSQMKTYGWDDIITTESIPQQINNEIPSCSDSIDQVSQVKEYLQTLFEPDDKVSYVTTAYTDDDGKHKPHGGSCSRSCKDLIDQLDKHTDNLTDVIGDLDDEAGAWICINPVDGKGRKDGNIVGWRYALIESDTIPIKEQWYSLQKLRLPIAIVVHSGGKSLHAIVHIDAKDAKEYRQRVDQLYKYCTDHGFPVDTANKNASRLSRLPGIKRGENWQYIVHGAMGAGSWNEWNRENLSPLPIHVMDGRWERLLPLKEELIHGILRQKHKMILVGSSKAGKSFSLIQLAVCIAEGQSWLGHKCEQGRVLYINLEIDEASFEHRIEKVYEAMDLRPSGLLEVVTLRGQKVNIDELTDRIPQGIYAAIIIDPFYKFGVEDENAAGPIGEFCRKLDRMSEKTGASVVYCHHHSKGVQSGKNPMDRGSGSGVFARDADAFVDILELSLPPAYEAEAKEKYGDWCVPCKIDFTLREFAKIDPIMCFYSYPLLRIDEDGWLYDAKPADVEQALSYGRNIGAKKNQIEREKRVAQLRESMLRDKEFGKVKSKDEYAKELGVTKKSIERYMAEDDPELYEIYYGFYDKPKT